MQVFSVLKRFSVAIGLCIIGLYLFAPSTPVVAAEDVWTGRYYNNMTLSGTPALVREDDAINFNWGTGSPDDVIQDDHFSVRWTMTTYFDAGRYLFTTTTDDGVRLYVDDQLVINQWHNMEPTSYTATIRLSSGKHALRMEYYENLGGAYAFLGWTLAPTREVGNIITCVRPTDSWIKVYRLDGNTWLDLNKRGVGANSASGFLKFDGLLVDQVRFGGSGHPYIVELWANGSLIRSVGNTARGEPEFRVWAGVDNYTPWGCPAP